LLPSTCLHVGVARAVGEYEVDHPSGPDVRDLDLVAQVLPTPYQQLAKRFPAHPRDINQCGGPGCFSLEVRRLSLARD